MTSRHEHRRRRSIRLRTHDYRDAGAYFVTICAHRRVPMFGRVTDGLMRLNACGKIADEEWWRTKDVRPYVALLPYEFVVMPDHVHGIVRIAGRRAGSIVDPDARPIEDPDAGPIVDRDAGPIVDRGVGAQRRCAPTSRPSPMTPSGIRAVAGRSGAAGGLSADVANPGGAVPANDMVASLGQIERPRVMSRSLGAIVRAYKSAVTRRVNEARGTVGVPVWQRNYYERVIRDEAELSRIRAYIVENPARWDRGAPAKELLA